MQKNCLLRRQLAWIVKSYFLEKKKNKKKMRMLSAKFLPGMQGLNNTEYTLVLMTLSDVLN